MKKITTTALGILLLSQVSFSQTAETTTSSSDSTAISPKKNAEIKKGATIDRSNIKLVTVTPSTPATTTTVIKEEEVTPATPAKNQPKKK